jgi:hypothetical protein
MFHVGPAKGQVVTEPLFPIMPLKNIRIFQTALPKTRATLGFWSSSLCHSLSRFVNMLCKSIGTRFYRGNLPGTKIWSLPPAAAIDALEELRVARLKRHEGMFALLYWFLL